jgi:thioredoxin-like negative regulator of GroEL
MKIGTLLLLLAWAALARTEILVLDDSNFTTFLAQHSFVFVEFYSPTCSHCRDLQPEFELLGALAEDKNYFIAKVDSTVARKTSEAHEIQSYPTLKFFANGFSIDYRGERTGEKMLRWIDSYFTKRIASISDA